MTACSQCGQVVSHDNREHICATLVMQPIEDLGTDDANCERLGCGLPFALNLMVTDYQREKNPFVRIHRLCDALEILTRLVTAILLRDLLEQAGEFPDSLRQPLLINIERPSFGGWRSLLEITCDCLCRQRGFVSAFVSGLPRYVKEELLPALGGSGGDPAREILALRNLIYHFGRISDTQALELLADHQKILSSLLLKFEFISDYEFFGGTVDARIFSLKGSEVREESVDVFNLPPETRPKLAANHVLISHNSEFLDLFPLHVFAEIPKWRTDRLETGGDSVPQLYFRSNKKGYLEFTPFSHTSGFVHHHGSILESFRQTFPLDDWRRTIELQQSGPDFRFDELLLELGEVFVGREAHLDRVSEVVSNQQQGVLWISGKPGVGKSALMARLVHDYRAKTQQYLAIPYFFRIGHSGCSTEEFINTVLLHLQKAMGGTLNLAPTTLQRRQQFVEVIRDVGRRVGKKILFLVDGIDEIYRLDPAFISLVFAAIGPNVIWLCAGRSEPFEIEVAFAHGGAIPIFDEGMPAMGAQTVRAMLTAHLERLKYELFERDEARGGEYHNRFVEVLVRKSEGLPLYVRMVVDDLCEGKWTLSDEDKLPQGLRAYFEQILERLGVSSIGTVLTPLFALLAWAKEPVTEPALRELLSRHHLCDDPNWDSIFRQALEHGHLMLRHAPTPEGESGYTFYHDTFRQYLLESERVAPDRLWAQRSWLYWCGRWNDLNEQPTLQRYALRNYPEHIFETRSWPELFALAEEEAFYDTQTRVCINQPELPLWSVQLALQAATETDNASAMAKFLISHARRLTRIIQESPLDALRNGQIQRGWLIADLHDIERNTLWHLILASELTSIGNLQGANRTLERLLKKAPPLLSDWGGSLAARLLARLFDYQSIYCIEFMVHLLNDEHRLDLIRILIGRKQFQWCDIVVQYFEQNWNQANALRELAVARATSGDFATALSSANAIHNIPKRTETVSNIVEMILATVYELSSVGATDEALALIPLLQTGTDTALALQVAALGQLRAGEFEKAIQTARSIGDQQLSDFVLYQVAAAQAKVGKVSESLELVSLLQENALRRQILPIISLAQVRIGEFLGALKTVHQISESRIRLGMTLRIVRWMMKLSPSNADDGSQRDSSVLACARFLLNMSTAATGDDLNTICAAASDMAEVKSETRNEILLQMVQMYASARLFDSAFETLQNISKGKKRRAAISEIVRAQVDDGKVSTLSELKKRFVDKQRLNEALFEFSSGYSKIGRLDIALGLANEIDSPHAPDELLAEFASDSAKAGRLEVALGFVDQINSAATAVRALCDIARAEGDLDKWLPSIFETALTRAAKIPKATERLLCLKTIASRQLAVGARLGARTTLARALDEMPDLSIEKKLIHLQDIARLQKLGDFDDEARDTLALAVKASEQSSFGAQRAQRLLNIFKTQKDCGFLVESRTSLDQALEWMSTLTESPSNEKVVRQTAVDLAKSGDLESAVKVLERITDQNSRVTLICLLANQLTKPTRNQTAKYERSLVEEARSRAKVAARRGRKIEAADALSDALLSAEQIGEVGLRCEMLRNLASDLESLGESAIAIQTKKLVESIGMSFFRLTISQPVPQPEPIVMNAAEFFAPGPAESTERIAGDDSSGNEPHDASQVISQNDDHTNELFRTSEPQLNNLHAIVMTETMRNELTAEIEALAARIDRQATCRPVRDQREFKKIELPEQSDSIEQLIESLLEQQTVWEGDAKSDAILNAALVQVQQGDIEAARQLLHDINDDEARGWVLLEIAMRQIADGDLAGAMRSAEVIVVPEIRVDLLRDIGTAYSESGQLEEAARIFTAAECAIDKMGDSSARAEAMQNLAIARLNADMPDTGLSAFLKARNIIGGIQDIESQVRLRLSLAERLAEYGFGEEARMTFSSATERITDRPEPERVKILQALALTQIEMKQFGKASSTIHRIPEGRDRLAALFELATAQARLGQFAEALSTAKLVTQKWQRARLLSKIALARAEAGFNEEARQIFMKARSEALEVKETPGREAALSYVASGLAQAMDFGTALEVSALIEDDALSIESLENIAVVQARAGLRDSAIGTFAMASERTSRISNETNRAVALRRIAIAESQAGFGEQAIRTSEGILTDRSVRLTELAISLVATDQRESFKRLLIPCAYYPDASLRLCGLLARVYPEQVAEIAIQVVSV